jgi:hypothetical protein
MVSSCIDSGGRAEAGASPPSAARNASDADSPPPAVRALWRWAREKEGRWEQKKERGGAAVVEASCWPRARHYSSQSPAARGRRGSCADAPPRRQGR